MLTPAEIAESLNDDEQQVLRTVAKTGRIVADHDLTEHFVELRLFAPGDLSFILEVTDLGRAVAKEIEKWR